MQVKIISVGTKCNSRVIISMKIYTVKISAIMSIKLIFILRFKPFLIILLTLISQTVQPPRFHRDSPSFA